MSFLFDDVARLPAPDDNIAIATRQLDAGTQIQRDDHTLEISHTVLTGHRFAITPLKAGDALRSWGQTFGIATRDIATGEYVCNATVLQELRRRSLDFPLPDVPNFRDDLEIYQFDEATFQPAAPLPRYDDTRTFMGYERSGGRGVGTRNVIILLGTSSMTTGFVQRLASRLSPIAAEYANVDAIVPVTHTEGSHQPVNNRELVLRTLAGFVVHPNVAAALIVDYGQEAITNAQLAAYMQQHNYPLDVVPHQFMSLSHSFEDDTNAAEKTVTGWLDMANGYQRTPQSLSNLKIALQCGGSDAFSGISGNPLAAWVAKEIIRYGGSANLAETDELIGAETYVLDKVRDSATAQKFLSFIERFKERVAWHGHSAEGNPSGGNKYRGLYNIYLKSLGAAMKRHPDVPLDYVIDYSERMQQTGYYFMDSPGNDLESVAGQVAAGCNMIFFVTGNGSITNFPFVPTIKIITTTERYELLNGDMDINAGAYLDGTPLESVGADTLQYTIDVASGQLSVGEKAGHSQVQIWRDWQLTHAVNLQAYEPVECSGEPITINTDGVTVPDVRIPVYQAGEHVTTDRVGLILPTSLCSGQIARMCVAALNSQPDLTGADIARFVTLVHTEGCGGSVNNEFRDTLLGYLAHPFVKHALLLEHGCESTHNAYFQEAMRARGFNPADYGQASIQLDGGIQSVIQKMIGWFREQINNAPPDTHTTAGLEAVRLAIVTPDDVAESTAQTLARLTQLIVATGGTVITGEQDALLNNHYAKTLRLPQRPAPTLNYAHTAKETGFHVMAMPTHDWGETLTGLGAAGVELILACTHAQPITGHPMIPVLTVSDTASPDADVLLSDNIADNTAQVLSTIVDTLAHRYTPALVRSGNVNFQVTRGLLGVSL